MSDPIVLSYHDTLLRQSDVRLLVPPNWLNDRLLSFCFQYYEYQLFPKANFAFISPDVAQFVKLSPLEELDIFLSPLNLKGKDIIFLPVNDNSSASRAGGGHWSLLAYFGKSNEFYHYDSSGSFNRQAALLMSRKMAKYLKSEANVVDTGAPQQRNSHDCGLYVLCITEHLCRQSLGDTRLPLNSVVTAESVSRKRSELKKLIQQLAEKK